MNRLALIAVIFAVVWYLWWRVRRRFAMITATMHKPKRAEQATGPLTLEKDPVTGVYRTPKG